MTGITDELLLAYIDGELSREDRATVEAALASDPDVAERLHRHQAVGARVHAAFAPVAEEAPPERLVRMIKPAAAVVSLEAARAKRDEPKPQPKAKTARPTMPINARWGAIAAALVIGVGLGVFAPRPEAGLVNGEMQATAVLRAGLDSKLASAPSGNGQIQVGLTFRDKNQTWCRTFTSRQGAAGVACRQGEGWQVRMIETGAPVQEADFRQAASATSPAVLAAVEGLIAGEPADAATEKKAKASGWR